MVIYLYNKAKIMSEIFLGSWLLNFQNEHVV